MLKEILLRGAQDMGIPMSDAQAAQFERYHALLTQANARMNLTRVPDTLREAVDRNYLDCIAPLAHGFPAAKTAVDVGSGAGFPGIPMAIMLPGTRFTLLDSLGKRVEFLQSAVEALGLNARAVQLRAEDAARVHGMREAFDLAVARAVAPVNVLSEYLLPLVRVGGWMLAMKGPNLDRELAEGRSAIAQLGGEITRTVSLPVPGRDWDHRAAWIAKVSPTPERYPRRAGVPEKRPLV